MCFTKSWSQFIIQGFILTALTAAITTVVNKKEAFSIINSVIGIAQTLFREEIWSYQCDLFSKWEANQGITYAIKRTSSAGFVRSRALVNTRHSYSSSTPDRWKSWIAQAIDTGQPWLGFHIHINSLVASLVQHFIKF